MDKYGRSLFWCVGASCMLIVAHLIFLGNANDVCCPGSHVLARGLGLPAPRPHEPSLGPGAASLTLSLSPAGVHRDCLNGLMRAFLSVESLEMISKSY